MILIHNGGSQVCLNQLGKGEGVQRKSVGKGGAQRKSVGKGGRGGGTISRRDRKGNGLAK